MGEFGWLLGRCRHVVEGGIGGREIDLPSRAMRRVGLGRWCGIAGEWRVGRQWRFVGGCGFGWRC